MNQGVDVKGYDGLYRVWPDGSVRRHSLKMKDPPSGLPLTPHYGKDGRARLRLMLKRDQRYVRTGVYFVDELVRAAAAGVEPSRSSYSRRPIQDLEEHFWSKVDIAPSGCMEWQGSRFGLGYGDFSVRRRGVPAHRYSWELAFGEIPDGLQVCHHCDNPPCVNPAHLFVGTAKDNAQDRDAKGRWRGSELTGEDHPNSKLTNAQRREIVIKCRAGHTKLGLAKEYGVARYVIQQIMYEPDKWMELGDPRRAA